MYYDLKESGKRIKMLRKKYGLSQNELAEILGIHVKTISKTERGVTGLSVDNLLIVADYFDTSIDYLIRGNRIICEKGKLYELISIVNEEQQKAAYKILENILKFPKKN